MFGWSTLSLPMSVDLSIIISVISLTTSVGTLIKYIFDYKQQQKQIARQERQIEQQEQQLAAYEKELDELSRQTELAELEHEAHLEIDDYKLEGDRVIVTISNYGNGLATELQVETLLTGIESEHRTPEPVTSDLKRREGENVSIDGRTIQANEQGVEFVGTVIVGVKGPTGTVHQRSFRSVFQNLQQEGGCNIAQLELSVRAKTLSEKVHTVVVTRQPLSVHIQDQPPNSTLEEVSARRLGS